MIQENIGGDFCKDFRLGSRTRSVKAFKLVALIWALWGTSVSADLPLTKISALYFNSDHSLVIETEDRNELELATTEKSSEMTKLVLANAKLNSDVAEIIEQGDLELRVDRSKSDDRSWFKSKDLVVLELRNKSGKKLDPELNTILEGLAYQIDFLEEKQAKVAEDIFELAEVKQELVDIKPEATHKLNVSLSERGLLSFIQTKSVAEEFLASIDLDLSNDKIFVEETFQKIDSTSLAHIGSALEARGKLDSAFRAYNEALQIDPSNINARLGLARTSTNNEEKLENFLAAIDSQALEEVGKEWHRRGIENNDEQAISSSLIPFQLSVLKNPKSPESRLAYARVLEESGPDYYSQASKRYLEAAVLSKDKYLAGEENYKPMLRKSTESLIRTLTLVGDQDLAIKYCNSYLGLGFSNFLDGRSVAGIMKEIKYNRNPFLES